MPSHDQNLSAIRAACVAANPELGKWPRWFKLGGQEYKPVIRLEDVLLALDKIPMFKEGVPFIAPNGSIYLRDRNGVTLPSTPLVYWNLHLPLSSQSEETVAYLASLLVAQ